MSAIRLQLRTYRKALLCAWFGYVVAAWNPVFAQTPPFYQGKTITVIQGREPGGSGDMRAKATAQFLQKYIPGRPTIVHEYMPGGGGLRAANHIYLVARPDGLTIGSVSSGMLSTAVLGGTGVKYEPAKFSFLGSPDGGAQFVFYTRKDLGVASVEKLRATPGIRVGAQSVGHSNYNVARLLAYVLRLKEPRFVTGYSSPEIDAALLRGEVDARFNQADSVLQRNREWMEKNMMDWHVVLEIPKGVKHHHFGNLPEIESFARTDKERGVLALQRAFRIIGSPFILPPGAPQAQVGILQDAMRKGFQDPQFRAEFKKLVGDDPEIVMPEVMERSIKELPRDPEIIATLKALAGPGPLPPN
jgi:tripartite-type tricarboxylate transporter receptor subunit TctC